MAAWLQGSDFIKSGVEWSISSDSQGRMTFCIFLFLAGSNGWRYGYTSVIELTTKLQISHLTHSQTLITVQKATDDYCWRSTRQLNADLGPESGRNRGIRNQVLMDQSRLIFRCPMTGRFLTDNIDSWQGAHLLQADYGQINWALLLSRGILYSQCHSRIISEPLHLQKTLYVCLITIMQYRFFLCGFK